MIKISLDTFCRQWVKDGKMERTIVSRFQKNIEDFGTVAGVTSRRFFRRSFSYGGFYKSGSKWAPRQSKWGIRHTHDILLESYRLRNGIQGDGNTKYLNQRGWTNNRKRIRNDKMKYVISTSEFSVGKRARKGRFSNYAAIHNTDPKLHSFTVNGYSGKKPVQRQFMGFNAALDAEINKHIHILFKGFPNDQG